MTDVARVPGGKSVGDSAGATGRIVRGLAANTGGIGIAAVIQLVSVPVLLGAWGVAAYGEWLVLSAIPTYVALSSLRFASVAGNSMVMLIVQDRTAEAVTLGRRLWSIVTAMTAIAVVASVTIALVFGGAFGRRAAIPTSEAEIVLVALFLQVAVGNQYGVLEAWFLAGGRYPLGSVLSNVGRLFAFGALIGSALLGARPGTAAIAFLAGSVAGFGVSWVVLRRVVPWSSFRPERPHAQTFRALLTPGLAFMAFPAGNALSIQGFTITIGATLGAAAVVAFTTTRTLTRIAFLAMTSINSSISPELSRSVGGRHLDEARAILRRAVQLSLVVSLLLVAALAWVGAPVIQFWTRSLVDPSAALLSILLLVIVANATWYTLSSVMTATNQHKRLAVVYLASSAASLVASVPLSLVFGLPGSAVALLVIDTAMVLYVFPAALRAVQDAPIDFLRSLLDVRGAVRSAVAILRRAT